MLEVPLCVNPPPLLRTGMSDYYICTCRSTTAHDVGADGRPDCMRFLPWCYFNVCISMAASWRSSPGLALHLLAWGRWFTAVCFSRVFALIFRFSPCRSAQRPKNRVPEISVPELVLAGGRPDCQAPLVLTKRLVTSFIFNNENEPPAYQ